MKESYNEHAKSKVRTNDCLAVSFRRTVHAQYRQLMGWAILYAFVVSAASSS